MLPSSTVENYLKAIYQGQSALDADDHLVSMGHVASALRVTPGTATTMIKALAESGLAEYEPYNGVRLTAAGERLAALVLRRHPLPRPFVGRGVSTSLAPDPHGPPHPQHSLPGPLVRCPPPHPP